MSGLDFGYGTARASGMRIAIYPTGTEVWSAAASDASPSIITASTNRITLHDDGDEDQIALASPYRFSHVSPRAAQSRRFPRQLDLRCRHGQTLADRRLCDRGDSGRDRRGGFALVAARSGIEWGLHRAIAAGTCPAASTELVLGEGALEGFRVVVSCNATIHVEGTRTRTHVVLRAHAEFADADAREHVVREVGASAVL